MKPTCADKVKKKYCNYQRQCKNANSNTRCNAFDEFHTFYAPNRETAFAIDRLRFFNDTNFTLPNIPVANEIWADYEVMDTYTVHAQELGRIQKCF